MPQNAIYFSAAGNPTCTNFDDFVTLPSGFAVSTTSRFVKAYTGFIPLCIKTFANTGINHGAPPIIACVGFGSSPSTAPECVFACSRSTSCCFHPCAIGPHALG